VRLSAVLLGGGCDFLQLSLTKLGAKPVKKMARTATRLDGCFTLDHAPAQ
jgi:hypothetical protein